MTALEDLLNQASAAAATEAEELAAAQVNYLHSQQDLVARTAELADAKTALAAVQAALAGTPKPRKPTLGFAVGTSPSRQACWNTVGGSLIRWYDTNLPTVWTGGKVTGPTSWVASVKPDIAQTIADALDTQISNWARTIPAGARVVYQHEPENKTKGIAPADFADGWVKWAGFVRAAAPATVKVGAVFMTYTVNDRPDTKGSNPWLAALTGQAQRPDFIGLDGYSHATYNWRSAQQEFGPSAAYARTLFPHAELIAAEWGQDKAGTDRAQWVRDAYAYFTSTGFTACCYFNLTGTTGDYTLDPATLTALKEASQ